MSSDHYYIQFVSTQKPWPIPQFYVVEDKEIAVALCQRLEKYFSKLGMSIQYTFSSKPAGEIDSAERFVIDQHIKKLAEQTRDEHGDWLAACLDSAYWYRLARDWHGELTATSPAPPDTDGSNAAPSGRKQARKRGRPQDTNKQQDRRIAEAWRTKQHDSLADLANTLGLKSDGEAHTVRDVQLAIDRERKRRQRSKK